MRYENIFFISDQTFIDFSVDTFKIHSLKINSNRNNMICLQKTYILTITLIVTTFVDCDDIVGK